MSDEHVPTTDHDAVKAIKIDVYITESKLSEALRQLLSDRWLADQVRLGNTRQRCDMAYQIGRTVTVVEYDGDEHYRQSIKIKSDRVKDEMAHSQGYRIVRFPYLGATG